MTRRELLRLFCMIAVLWIFAGALVLTHWPTAKHETFGAARSPHWPKVRAEHLAKFPTCAACGTDRDPQVHHVQPLHLGGAELDPGNLITLCGPGGHGCHFAIGHLWDFKRANPKVREDAGRLNQRLHEVMAP